MRFRLHRPEVLRKLCLALVAGILPTVATHGFVIQTLPSGAPFRWNLDFFDPDAFSAQNPSTLAIRYSLSTGTSSAATRDAEWNCVRAAFAQWAAIPGTKLKFEETGTIAAPADVNSEDSINSVVWFSGNRLVCGGRAFFSSSAAALTCTATLDDGTIVEADMILNKGSNWFTDYNAPKLNSLFMESVVLHEIGHLLGLNHSPLGAATMFWQTQGSITSQSGLSPDETRYLRSVYGTTATRAANGTIKGTVKLGGSGVFGAVVVAEDALGIVQAGTLTAADGSYSLPGLSPGAHSIRVTPLDPTGNLDAYLVRGFDIDEYRRSYSNAVTTFQTMTNPPVNVTAGGTLDVSVAVPAGNPAFRITEIRSSFNPADRSSSDGALRLQRGQKGAFLGVFVPNLPGTNATLRLTGPGVSYGATTVTVNALRGIPLVQVEVSIQTNAIPGIRSLWLEAGGKVAWANGFAEVLPDYPDDNLDGLDDTFQRRYFSPFTRVEAAPAADPDGDGWTNDREAAAGSNPTDPISTGLKVLSTKVSGAGTQVTAETAVGKKYQLWARPDVAGGTWKAVGGVVVASAKTQVFVDAEAKELFRFYRIQQVP